MTVILRFQITLPGKACSRFNRRGSVKWPSGHAGSGQLTSSCTFLALTEKSGIRLAGTNPHLPPARQIFHIRRSFKLLSQEKQQILRSTRQRVASGKHDAETADADKRQLRALEQKKLDLQNDCWVQAGYLPLTAHWYVRVTFRSGERARTVLLEAEDGQTAWN